jgi:hypothetical protein
MLVATEQEAAHAGFQIDRELTASLALLMTRSVCSTHWITDSR